MALANDSRRSLGRLQSCLLARLVRDRWLQRQPADEAAEILFRRAVELRYPEDKVWGEEQGAPSNWSGDGWVIDPVDGTHNFLAGIPLFSISVAWVKSGEPQLGWVVDPIRGEWFEAVRGGGVVRGGPGPAPFIKPGTVPVLALSPRWRRKHPNWRSSLPKPFKERSLGSIALEMAWISQGRLGAGAWSRGRPWDIAAGVLLVEESRGRVAFGNGPGRLAVALDTKPIESSIVAVSATACRWLSPLLQAPSGPSFDSLHGGE